MRRFYAFKIRLWETFNPFKTFDPLPFQVILLFVGKCVEIATSTLLNITNYMQLKYTKVATTSPAGMNLSGQKDQCNAMNPTFEDLHLKLQRIGSHMYKQI